MGSTGGDSGRRATSGDRVREPAEVRFADELGLLEAADDGRRPPGWRLSPRAVRTFVLGGEVAVGKGKKRTTSEISRKFHGDDPLVERAIVTLMSNRGLLMIGEPGTAKSMLSELFAAAISGTSRLTVQGTAGTTEDQIHYSWNYALLLADGPVPRALVPGPLHEGLRTGRIVRFEEITRCPPEIQDTLISVLSEKVLHVPELRGDDDTVFARPGFNVIATANTRDRGVHEMSAALKRRFNFETVRPISDPAFEIELVRSEAGKLLSDAGAQAELDPDVLEVLVTTFAELREGRTPEGTAVDRPSTVMSTAEAVAVAFSAGLEACWFGDGRVEGAHLARQLVGTVLKDSEEDAEKVRHYFDVVVKARRGRSRHWKSFWEARRAITR